MGRLAAAGILGSTGLAGAARWDPGTHPNGATGPVPPNAANRWLCTCRCCLRCKPLWARYATSPAYLAGLLRQERPPHGLSLLFCPFFPDLRAGASTGSHRICRYHQPLSPTRPRVGPVPTAAGRASSERPCGPPRGQLQLALRARRCLQRGWVFASPEETRGRERPKGSAKPLVMTPFGGHPRAALRSRLSCTAPHPLLLTALVAGKGAPAEQFSHLLGW